ELVERSSRHPAGETTLPTNTLSRRSDVALLMSTQPIDLTSAPIGSDAYVRPAPTVATYQRRRLVVLLAVMATLLVCVVAATGAGAARRDVPASVWARRPASGILAGTPDAGTVGQAVAAPAAYVVQPGDTLWGIARRLQPEGDVRDLVDELV